MHRRIDGIEDLGAVQTDHGDPSRTFDENGLRHQVAQFAFVIYGTVALLSHNGLPSAGCSGSQTI
jgi:hypothetical protein